MIEATVKRIKLSDARTQLLMTQREFAEVARDLDPRIKLSTKVISNAENGFPIRRLTAQAIYKTLNYLREEKGLPTLEWNEIEWTISGE